MSTRSMTEFHWGSLSDLQKFDPSLGQNTDYDALLYHHSDGYPDFMLPKVISFLKTSFKKLEELGYPYWWDGERVAALFVMLSAGDYRIPEFGGNGEPKFHPAIHYHGDLEYLYRVFLVNEGQFHITINKIDAWETVKITPIGEYASAANLLTGKHPRYTKGGKPSRQKAKVVAYNMPQKIQGT